MTERDERLLSEQQMADIHIRCLRNEAGQPEVRFLLADRQARVEREVALVALIERLARAAEHGHGMWPKLREDVAALLDGQAGMMPHA